MALAEEGELEQPRVFPRPLRSLAARVIVTGLPPHIRWQDLKDHMRMHGRLKALHTEVRTMPAWPRLSHRARLSIPDGSQVDRGVGICDYTLDTEAARAVELLDGTNLGGSIVRVFYNQPLGDLMVEWKMYG